jgi:hypothetical protein
MNDRIKFIEKHTPAIANGIKVLEKHFPTVTIGNTVTVLVDDYRKAVDVFAERGLDLRDIEPNYAVLIETDHNHPPLIREHPFIEFAGAHYILLRHPAEIKEVIRKYMDEEAAARVIAAADDEDESFGPRLLLNGGARIKGRSVTNIYELAEMFPGAVFGCDPDITAVTFKGSGKWAVYSLAQPVGY